MKYALKNVNIITGIKNDILSFNKTILINDNIIEKIINSNQKYDNTYKTFEMNNKYVIPGMINLHVHLFGSGKPSKALGGGRSQKMLLKLISSRLGKKVLDKIVKNHALTQLYSGVTTIRTVGDFHYSDVRIRDKINNKAIIGPRMIVSGPAITTSNGHGAGTFAVFSDTIAGLKQLVRDNYKMKVDFIKTCTTGGVMDAKKRGEPGEVKMTVEQTKAICDEAHRLGLKVASHVESKEGIKTALLGGVDTIEHGSILDDESIKLFKDNNSSFTLTISPALPLAKLDYNITKLTEFSQYNSNIVFNNMISCANTVIKENIKIGLGTDASCPFVSQYNTYKEMIYAVKYLNISSLDAINICTLSNASILGLDDKIGSIEEGKIADILILNDNPINCLETLKKPFKVIFDGKILKNRRIKHIKLIDSIIEKI